MNEQEVKQTLVKINDSLEPCPICKKKAEVMVARVINFDNLSIECVGCPKCHLLVERKMHKKVKFGFFPKWSESVVDAVQIWNNITKN